MDNFENELRDLMDSFDKEPEKNTWPKILKGLDVNYGIYGLNILLPVAAAFLVLCVGSVNLFKQKATATISENELIAMDTLMFTKGKEAFKMNCATCHNIDMSAKGTAPALLGVTQRRSKDWLFSFTRNSQSMIGLGDSLALLLWKEYQPLVMTSFIMSDGYMDTLYYFIEKASEKAMLERNNLGYFETGEQLFDRYCDRCHTVSESTEKVGHSIADFAHRHQKDWVVRYTKNSERLLIEEDSLALACMENRALSNVRHSTTATEEQIDKIIDYVKFSAN